MTISSADTNSIPTSYGYGEEAVRLSIGRSTPRSGFRLELRGGEQRDLSDGQHEQVYQANLYATYRPSQALFLTAYGGVGGDEHLIGSRLLGRSNNVGASATWLASERLGMSVWYSRVQL